MGKPTERTDAEKKANSKSDAWAALAVILLALVAVVLFLDQPD